MKFFNSLLKRFSSRRTEESAETVELETQKMIGDNGYGCETHKVTTGDNYVLTMFRVLPKEGTRKQNEKLPVILQHGIYCDSSTWVCTRNPRSLACMLVDAGYDLWMCDSRGTGQSKAHAHMDPEKNKSYWRFSFQDMAEHDFPAAIEHVLKSTGKPKVHWVGHSQGTMIALAGLSHDEQLNEKLASFQALAPVFSVKHLPKHINLLANFLNSRIVPTSLMKDMELKPCPLFYNTLFAEFSTLNRLTSRDPRNIIFGMLGMHPDRFVEGTKDHCFSDISGVTFRNLMHLSQVVLAGTARKYDHGKDENLKVYGSEQPPEYDVTKTKVPTALYFGKEDLLTHEKDQEYLKEKLPNVVHCRLIENFDHFDFMWGVNAPEELNKVLIENLEKI